MRVNVKVKLKSSQAGVRRIDETTYEVATNEAPEKGKANRDVIRQLAEHLAVPPSRVWIVAGHASRSKIVAVED